MNRLEDGYVIRYIMETYMKTCTKCQQTKPTTDFYAQTDRKNGASYCKSCFNSYCQERWTKRKLKAISYLGGCCRDCGYSSHHAALQFHHIDPTTKEFMWNKMRLLSWAKTVAELDKCELLCANCHAIRHSS